MLSRRCFTAGVSESMSAAYLSTFSANAWMSTSARRLQLQEPMPIEKLQCSSAGQGGKPSKRDPRDTHTHTASSTAVTLQ